MKSSIMMFCFLAFFVQYAMAQYQFLKMVQQWPPATCRKLRCSPNRRPQNFTVHGVWPSNATVTPKRCNPINGYNTNLVKSLFPRINNSWPDLKGYEDKFWQHEWEEHGSCSQSNFDVLGYFTLGLDIKDRLYLLDAFSSRNIQPDAMRTYNHNIVAGAIKARTGKDPELRCILHGQQSVYLHEVVLCLDSTGKNYKDCPQTSDFAVKACYTDFQLLPL